MDKQLKMNLEPLNLELLPPAVNIDLSLKTMTKLLQDNNCLLQDRKQLVEVQNEPSNQFLSPRKRKLLYACAKGNIDTVRNLVQHEQVSPNFCNYDKRTPLHLAAAEGHLEIAQILVEAGASLSTYDRWGCTPLFDAMNGKHQRLTQYFFDAMQDNNIPTRRHSTSCSTPFDPPYSCRYAFRAGSWSPISVETFNRTMDNEETIPKQESQEDNQESCKNLDRLQDNSISLLQQINEEYTRKQKQLLKTFQQQKQNLFQRRLSRTCTDLED